MGLEPTTVGLRVQRSTDWASRADCASLRRNSNSYQRDHVSLLLTCTSESQHILCNVEAKQFTINSLLSPPNPNLGYCIHTKIPPAFQNRSWDIFSEARFWKFLNDINDSSCDELQWVMVFDSYFIRFILCGISRRDSMILDAKFEYYINDQKWLWLMNIYPK